MNEISTCIAVGDDHSRRQRKGPYSRGLQTKNSFRRRDLNRHHVQPWSCMCVSSTGPEKRSQHGTHPHIQRKPGPRESGCPDGQRKLHRSGSRLPGASSDSRHRTACRQDSCALHHLFQPFAVQWPCISWSSTANPHRRMRTAPRKHRTPSRVAWHAVHPWFSRTAVDATAYPHRSDARQQQRRASWHLYHQPRGIGEDRADRPGAAGCVWRPLEARGSLAGCWNGRGPCGGHGSRPESDRSYLPKQFGAAFYHRAESKSRRGNSFLPSNPAGWH